MELRELSIHNIEEIKSFFVNVFSKEPWNDDWSNDNQLHSYIKDLIGNNNSLSLGLFENNTMVGLSMGHIRHWYSGTSYFIDEFCIKTELQGKGSGSKFLQEIEQFIKTKGIVQVFLQTERTMPAYQFYKKNGYTELRDHITFVKETK